ncbi:cellulose-binding protein [Micromonospora sp. NPDC093277]|uniref:glucuronyl esterase domain-containing protein n=1 Tax=Micromonospora sp. NPDC093277 TaxID=3364291 RepID=UPI0038249E9F
MQARIAILAALSLVAGLVAIVATVRPALAAVEDDGADCQVGSATLTSNSQLPDPFTRINGTRITTTSDWRCRRAEIKKLAEQYVYGSKPAKPTSVTGTVSNSNITVNVSHNGKNASFSASVQLPSGSGPFPAVVVVGGLGADTSTILGAGVAIINYDPLAVGKEGTARNNKQGAFYTIYGNTSSTGILAAWAWGVSRIIDVVEQSGGSIIRPSSIGVTGCSRYGKGTFAIGAFDQRIALTMPIESGSGGVPIFRGIAGESGAQPLSSAYSEQPWLGDAFSSFTGNPNNLPIDTHQIIGMIAPRGLFIMENPGVDWLATRSGSVAALAGAEIYRALGVTDNISYWSDVTNTTHCAVRNEWKAPMQAYLQKFLKGGGSTTSTFRIASSKAGNLSQWRSWTTPNLTGGGSTTPPPTTTPPTTTPPTTPPPGGCTVTLSPGTSWTDRFNVNLSVGGTNNWVVTIRLNGSQSLQNQWNATVTGTTGTLTARPNGNGNNFGITLYKNGNSTMPTATCAVG